MWRLKLVKKEEKLCKFFIDRKAKSCDYPVLSGTNRCPLIWRISFVTWNSFGFSDILSEMFLPFSSQSSRLLCLTPIIWLDKHLPHGVLKLDIYKHVDRSAGKD